jgi:hypothetical protein
MPEVQGGLSGCGRSLFVARRRMQLPETPALHLTAFLLDPVSVHRTISFEETRHVHSFLERYGDSPSLRTQFGHYRAQEGCFTSSAPAWDVQNNSRSQ